MFASNPAPSSMLLKSMEGQNGQKERLSILINALCDHFGLP